MVGALEEPEPLATFAVADIANFLVFHLSEEMPQKHLTLHSRAKGSICHYLFRTEKSPLSEHGETAVSQYTDFREVRCSFINDLSLQLLKVLSITAETTPPKELALCLKKEVWISQRFGSVTVWAFVH